MSGKTIITMSVLRVMFVASTSVITLNSTFLSDSDVIKIGNIALFALSNGYVSTQCAIKAPQYVKED